MPPSKSKCAKTQCKHKPTVPIDPSKGVQSIPGMIQLMLDWHHKMKIRGHQPAWSFKNIERFYRMYHKYKETGTLCPAEIQTLRNTVNGVPTNENPRGWSIRTWEAEHYPAEKGIALVPPKDATSLETLLPQEAFQNLFDWMHHTRATDFNADEFVISVYHQFKKIGRLTDRQREALIKIACRKEVRDWVCQNPDKKGTGLPPAEPEPAGCMLIDDEDDD